MTVTTNAGPYISYGITQSSTGQVTEYNEERAPSLSDLGYGMMDPRPFYRYQPGGAVGSKVLGLYGTAGFVDYVPTTASTNALVSNGSSAMGGTTLTLTATGAGIISTTIVAPEDGTTVSVYAIDSTAAYLSYGQSGTVAMWNPAAGTGRCISIVLSSNGDGGSFTVAGRDMYGYKMTETVATNSSNTISTTKAFKYISSITASTTITSTGFIIGYNNTFGFPLKLSYSGLNAQVAVLASAFSSAVIVALSSATTTLASTAATQTSTTPDVRGTYASTTAANGTVRLQILQRVSPGMVSSVTASDTSSLFGGTQYSSV